MYTLLHMLVHNVNFPSILKLLFQLNIIKVENKTLNFV